MGHKAVLIPSREGWGDSSFWKGAWLQPHSKERSASHTRSVDTRGTDMEKYKSWHVFGTAEPKTYLV